MIAALMHAAGDIRIEQVPDPVVRPGEALIRIRAVGVCASDLHFYRNGEIGGWGFSEPALLGHECSGEIVGLGDPPPAESRLLGTPGGSPSQVGATLQVGNRVAIEPTRPCGECDLCLTGHYNICRKLRFAGQPPDPGAFCEYVSAPLDRLFPLPDGVSFEEGAMVEPVAVAVHAVRLAGVQAGSRVAILGAGAIGLSILQVARAHGAETVFVSEPLPSRRALAETLGATEAIDPTQEDPREVIAAATSGVGVDIAFEASGGAEAPEEAAVLVGGGGVLVLVGIPDEDELVLPASLIRRREMTIKTVRRYRDSFPEALSLIAGGKVNARIFGTHHFPLEATAQAFAAAATRPSQVLRAIVDVPPAG